MIFTETSLKGAYLVKIKKLEDDRGFFGRAWCRHEFEEHGLNPNIKQINTSWSKKKGTIRGMHYQVDPYQETKFIRCTRGRIYDVIIDLRPDSPTFMQWTGHELSADNYTMMYVPEKFAHGFVTLEDDCEVYYPTTEFYTPGAERGIRYNDPAFNIEWPVNVDNVSEKDRTHPLFDARTFNAKQTDE
ncbi:MAG TPA: dTDP-4-dehydrorhamnose 3,5-epimerase [Bacteroidales bacterium]|nr:dTDP-4-dehydrorhamnose 3,5-epimerase [Bacteroidales bacterium]